MTFKTKVKVGAEMLMSGLSRLEGVRDIALVTNHTSLLGNYEWLVYRLSQSTGYNLQILLAPGHGLYGDLDGEVDELVREDKTGLPVLRLGSFVRGSIPRELQSLDLDAVFWDVQDAGVRHFTFWIELARLMQRAESIGASVVVLDRPNPLGGKVVGPVTDRDFKDYLYGLRLPIPIAYGLTVGELASMMKDCLGIGCNLQVIKMKGWKRNMLYADTGLPWVPLTPNLPTPETLLVYPGTSLVEGTNLSEGRGTTKPFEYVGAPWVEAHEMSRKLNDIGLPGLIFRAVHFVPMQHLFFPASTKHAGQRCRGVQLHVTDQRKFDPVRAGLEIVALALQDYEGDFQWDSSHFYRDATIPRGAFYFDTLVGTPKVREALEGGEPVEDIVDSSKDDLKRYLAAREKYLLY